MSEARKDYKWVGTRPVRPDGVAKVTGDAQFGADFHMPGALHGMVLRSPHAHARIVSIDTSKAEALTGVRAVMTGADLPDHEFACRPGPMSTLHMTRNIGEKKCFMKATRGCRSSDERSSAPRTEVIEVEYEVPHTSSTSMTPWLMMRRFCLTT